MNTEPKHTPGKWEARHRTDETTGDYPVTEYYVWAYPYGREAGPQGICDGILRKSDADLIAAAPELLEACKAMVEAVTCGVPAIVDVARRYAEAAIAKAEPKETSCHPDS